MIQERFVVTWELQRGFFDRVRNKDVTSGILEENFPGLEDVVLYMKAVYNINVLNWHISPGGESLYTIATNPFDGKGYTWKITALDTSDTEFDDNYTLVSN